MTSLNKPLYKLPKKHQIEKCLGRIPVQVTIYRRLQIGRDDLLDQPEAYDISIYRIDIS